MADEASWQNHVDSKQRGSVSANVNARRYGEEIPFEPDEAQEREESGDAPQHEPTDWERKFSHLPGVNPD